MAPEAPNSTSTTHNHKHQCNEWTTDHLYEFVMRILDEHREQAVLRHQSNEVRITAVVERVGAQVGSATMLSADVSRLQVQVTESGLRSKERLDGLTIKLEETTLRSTTNGTAIARLTAEAIALREATAAQAKCQVEATAKADFATEKRFDAVNEFRAQLGDQARTLMPRAEVEVIIRGLTEALKSSAATVAGLQTQVATATAAMNSQKVGTKEGWLYAVGAVGLVISLFTLASFALNLFRAVR